MTIDEVTSKMKQAVRRFEDDLKKMRTGRASASVLEGVSVDVYGSPMPLSHIANVLALDSQTLQVQPFDPSNLEAISAAIREDQSLGLNPADDGRVIRIPIPPMTEERRKEVVKQVHARAEEARVAIRNLRQDMMNQLKQDDLSEDDLKREQASLEELVSKQNSSIQLAADHKEKEVMTV